MLYRGLNDVYLAEYLDSGVIISKGLLQGWYLPAILVDLPSHLNIAKIVVLWDSC